MRAAAGLILLLLLAPVAEAAIAVGHVRVPDRTAATRPFPVSVTLHNDGPERTVTLLAALYAYEDGAGPCGPTTDGRFRAFTHVAQERVRLPANGQLVFPPEGRRWLQMYERDDVPAQPATMELCIFVAASERPGPEIEYEAFASVPLHVRQRNSAPTGDFSWTPAMPAATDDVTFTATAHDADGDPVTMRWDFGHANATGRATGVGERVLHFFYPEGSYVVTLALSDGIDETAVEKGIRVGPAAPPGVVPAVEVQPKSDTPLAWWIPLAALALLAWRRR